ncbi:MAG: tRNA threonylcarbamoyladenosine biosynthesis protein TsaE [Flavobacteriales bacterium]|jgi:tRNA threonylcarbamoyladenosine biosynthesis protein TsaE
MKTWNNLSLLQLKEIATQLWDLFPSEGVICFYGDMGVGKTTLINELAKAAGVTEETSSPTFSIVNEYRTMDDKKIYHFDCYRIEDEHEALDFGIEDYFYDQAISLVEWPEKVASLLPEKVCEVHLSINEDETRNLRFISVS